MILASWRDGVKRTVSAPAVLIGVFVMTFAMAVPLALTLRGMIGDHLGGSLAAEAVADGFDHDWWQEFRAQAAGLGVTFTPAVIGFAAVLDSLSGVVDRRPAALPLAGVLAVYIGVWTFLAGGIIDRYARQRPTRAHGFFGAAGAFFPRFLRLAMLAGAVYAFLFIYVHGWLFEGWLRAATLDVNVERTAFGWRLLLYGLFGGLLAGANVLFDYAKIRAVVEDRRSMLFALLASARFIRRNPGRIAGLYAVNAALFLLILAVWAVAAPGARVTGFAMWAGFAAAQLYVAARLFVKLQVLASQTALFQASLAHAAYTAAPAPVWPESPAAETLAPAP